MTNDFPVAAASALPCLDRILDQIDYGLMLVDEGGAVLHVNGTALALVGDGAPLALADGHVKAARAEDARALRDAFADAARRGRRALLVLGREAQRTSVAVVPIAPAQARQPAVTLVVIGRSSVCEALTAQWYARLHGLTGAEARVLELLCTGFQAQEIARRHRVALSTVRTQIGSIRAKTGARTIGSVVRDVALLPPLVDALRCGRGAQAPAC